MKWAVLVSLAVLLAACGGKDEQTAPGNRTKAARVASAPIIDRPEPVAGTPTVVTPASRPKKRATKPAAHPAAAGITYRAIGTEPFWAVAVRGHQATLERPGHASGIFLIETIADDSSLRFRGDGFAMTVTPGPCSDGMSDAIWSDRVQIAYGDGTLKGCGGERHAPSEDDRRDRAP